MRYQLIETPTGRFAVIERPDDAVGPEAGGLETGWVSGPEDRRLGGGRCDVAVRPDLVAALQRYFAGEPVDFADVRLPSTAEPGIDEDFFARCRQSCRTIPRGQTRTYAELAEMAGGPRTAARAAGQAMRRNPWPIIVPCHRILAAGGKLGGFGGATDPDDGQIRVKRWLLMMEGAIDADLGFNAATSITGGVLRCD